MRDSRIPQVKGLTWLTLATAFEPLGWSLSKSRDDIKVFERGDEKFSAVRFGDKWKVEYFVGRAIRDSAGFSDEWLARVLMMEMMLMRSAAPEEGK